jgi:hypothetical protein
LTKFADTAAVAAGGVDAVYADSIGGENACDESDARECALRISGSGRA